MKRFIVLFLVTGFISITGMGNHKSSTLENLSPRNREIQTEVHFSRPAEPEAGLFMLHESGEGVACREATPEEARSLSLLDSGEQLHTISRSELQSLNAEVDGLRIVLRATQQLERSQEARAAFLRAAAFWEDRVRTPITIIIDVDFGPTLFGTSFPPGSIGAANAQELTTTNIYASVRAKLIAKASSEQELAVYKSLPAGALPTDIGATTTMQGPSANARALGLLAPVADPGLEQSLGKLPFIGFNSNFRFDYDPDDGIDRDKVDFDAVVLHEIGHVLGFISKVGARELDSKLPVAPSVWDLFRLRPGADGQRFSTAQRILSSGGDQVFNVAGLELPLSTGRSNGTGGDNYQASHWKNDSLIGDWYIGVMEVGIPAGKRQVMTSNDLLALQFMGYELRSGIHMVCEPGKLQGKTEGDKLTLTGVAANISDEVIQAQVKLLDDQGSVVIEYPLTSFEPGHLPIPGYAFQFSGLDQLPAATQAAITFLDSKGNQSTTITGSILDGDAGGPLLKSLSLKGSEISIKGKRLTGQLEIEINGVVVRTVTGTSNKKLKIDATGLNLLNGPNRVRIVRDGLDSNILVLNS